jgi:hypothetical protein
MSHATTTGAIRSRSPAISLARATAAAAKMAARATARARPSAARVATSPFETST